MGSARNCSVHRTNEGRIIGAFSPRSSPMRRALIFAVLSITAAGTAQADGGRVEVHGGYDRLSYESFFSPSDSTFRPIEAAVIGIGLGYDVPIGGSAFAGIEANADFSTKSQCQVNPLILAPGIFESCLSPKRDLSMNARLGVKLGGERTRLYALAGYSNLKLNESFWLNRTTRTPVGSETQDGIRLGAGLEHDFGERLYGKIEYRYTDYGGNVSRSQGLVGLGIHF
jgi:outer membrane immunogenic protein